MEHYWNAVCGEDDVLFEVVSALLMRQFNCLEGVLG
jgi:hypothetical protein